MERKRIINRIMELDVAKTGKLLWFAAVFSAVLVLTILPNSLSSRQAYAVESTTFYIDKGNIFFSSGNASGCTKSGTRIIVPNRDHAFTITQTNASQPCTNTITVMGGDVSILLKDVNICTDRYSKTNAFSLFSEATVDLKVSGLNTIHSGHADYAGIRVAADAKLTISADDFGYLYAKSGQDSTPVYAAGIGGNNNESCGEVIINGGYITAVGKAAIGGGNYASGGTIVINGGEVNAEGIVVGIGNGWGYTGSEGAVTIKGGYVAAKSRSYGEGISSGKIRITGGTVKAVGTGCRGINSPAANIVVTGGTIFDSECRPYSNGSTDVYPTILALPSSFNVSEILVTQGDNNTFSYGAKDVRGDSVINNNKLTIFVPAYADNETTISVKVGGLTYNYHGMVSGEWPYYLKADQEPLSIQGIKDTHEFGDLISLDADIRGGSGNGAVTWLYEGTGTTSYSSDEAPIYPGTYKVTVTKAADDSYYETSASKEFKITGDALWFIIADIPSQVYTGSAIEPR
ncbi:MAG: hypothetical protein ABFD08_15550 [Syntrophomonas sp.]